jgi:predicted RND superfamily exporter protein
VRRSSSEVTRQRADAYSALVTAALTVRILASAMVPSSSCVVSVLDGQFSREILHDTVMLNGISSVGMHVFFYAGFDSVTHRLLCCVVSFFMLVLIPYLLGCSSGT